MGKEVRYSNPLMGGLEITNSDSLECSPFADNNDEGYSNATSFRRAGTRRFGGTPTRAVANTRANVAPAVQNQTRPTTSRPRPNMPMTRVNPASAIQRETGVTSRPSTSATPTPSTTSATTTPTTSTSSTSPANTTPASQTQQGGGSQGGNQGGSQGGNQGGGGGGSQGGAEQQEEQPTNETSEGSEQQETAETTDATTTDGSTETTESSETTEATTEGGDEESSNIGGADASDSPFYKTMWFWGAIAGGIGAYLFAKSKGKNLLAFTLLGSGVVGGLGYGIGLMKNKSADGGTATGGGDGKSKGADTTVKSKDSGDLKSKPSGDLADKITSATKIMATSMMSAMGMPKADLDKAMKDVDANTPKVKAKINQQLLAFKDDDKKALGEYVDYIVAQIPTKSQGDMMSMSQDPKKQKEAEDKMNAFWVTLKKKYPNADMVKVKGFMDGVY